MSATYAFRPPPEGVIAGENVPFENDEDDFDESLAVEIAGLLKARGEPYSTMRDYERAEKARQFLERIGDT